MKPNNPDFVFQSIQKAKQGECPPLSEDGEKAAKRLYDRMKRMREAVQVNIVVDGKSEPCKMITLNECRWIVHDQIAAGAIFINA